MAGKDDIKNILSELLAQCQEMIDTIRTMYSGILPPIASGGSDSSGHARSGDQSREGIPPPGTTGSGDQSVEGIHPPGTTGSGDQSGEGIPSTGYPRNQKLLNALESACLMTMLGKQKRQFGQPGRVSPPCRYLKQALGKEEPLNTKRLLVVLECSKERAFDSAYCLRSFVSRGQL